MLSPGLTITLLVDNSADNGLSMEHGLAFLIKSGDQAIIFDTGQGDALFANAQTLEIDLTQPEFLVLSHGHYDHTGGLAELLQINPKLKIFYHSGAITRRYSCHPDKPVKDISMPYDAREALECRLSHLLCTVDEPRQILPGIKITGRIPRHTSFEDTGGPFFLDEKGRVPDMIRDDMALWIETPTGLVIVLGCCHSGLINTVEYIRTISGIDRIRGIIGGMHLLSASEERLAKTCDKLREWSPEFIIPCHCTGEAAIDYMASKLGECVKPGKAGMVVDIFMA